MSKNYIGYINSNQTFTNDGIILSDNNDIQSIINSSIQLIINDSNINLEYIDTNFKYLKELLTKAKREINYLDIYKVDKAISETDMDKVGQYFSQLPPGHSLSITVPFVEFNGVVYKKGDLLLKKENGEAERISAPTGGLFFPQVHTSNHSVEWIYTSNEEVDQSQYIFLGDFNTVPIIPSPSVSNASYYFYAYDNIPDPSDNTVILYHKECYYIYQTSTWELFLEGDTFKSIEYKVNLPQPSNATRYNFQDSKDNGVNTTWTSDSFSIITISGTNEKLIPIMKFYNGVGSSYEEVFCDAQLEASGSYWVITNIPSYVTFIKAY